MEPKETKTRILNAAEHLFARNGYHGTSLRMITTKAKANLAAVNYHFGSKESLIKAVIKRKLLPLNQLRTKRLKEVLKKAKQDNTRPDAQETLAAFIEPSLNFRNSSPNAKDFITLIARAMADPNDTARNIFIKQVMPVFNLLHKCISKALPEIDPKTLHWRLHFMIGSLSHTMHNLDKLPIPKDMQTSDNTHQDITEMLLTFLTAGVKAPQ